MENHIAAAVIYGADSFSAYLTPTNTIVVLSIGSDAIFRASVETTGTQTGWTVTDVSPLLSTKYQAGTTLTARFFTASGSLVQGFSILLAVTVTEASGSFDEVWLLTGPGTDASSWLSKGDSMIWTKLAYDAVSSPPIETVTAATLQVSGLFLEHGLEASDPTLALATVVDPNAPGELRCFLLNLPISKNDDPVWSYYQQEQNIGVTNLQVVPGRISSYSSWGLYKLYTLDSITSLTFLPTRGFFGAPTPTLFSVPSGASAIASLVYEPSGSLSYTDLFVAANGFIGYFPYDQSSPHHVLPLIVSPLITGVTQLHAVNCNGVAAVWGLNSAGQVFYTQAPLAQLGVPSAWKVPIALLSHVKDIAALAGGAADTISLFAVAPLESTTATGNVGSGLLQLTRNASTGAWLNSVHPLPSATDYITLKTYTTRVLLVNSNNVPQAGATISATVSSDCSLIINGAVTQVSLSDTPTLTTDASGYVSFIHAVSSLASPSLTLTLPDGSVSTIDPTGTVVGKLASITQPAQLTNATYVDATGKTQNLVAAGTNTDAVPGVVKGLQTISAQLPSLPRGPASKSSSRTPTTAAFSTNDLYSDFGDLVQSISNTSWDDLVSVKYVLADEGLQFVVNMAGKELRAIIRTVEDALSSITALLAWIGAGIDAAFRWLGFLFDWKDFIATKNTLKGIINQSLDSFASIQSQLQTSGDAWFAHAKANVLPGISSTSKAIPSNQPLQSAWARAQPTPPPVGSGNTDLRSDPRLGWLKDRLNTAPSTDTSGAEIKTTNVADPTSALFSAMETLIKDVQTAFKELFADVGNLVSGKITASDFFASTLATAQDLGLDVAQTVFDALMSVIEVITSSIQSALNMPIDIPILSTLYKDATGSQLTLFDVTCLILGIGITLVYKIADGESPATALDHTAASTAVSHAITTTFTDIIKPPSSGFVVPVASPAAPPVKMAASAESPDALQKITGALLVIQAITMTVEGGAEMAEATSVSNIAFFVDLTSRTLRAALEATDDGEQMEESGTEIAFEFLWSMSLWVVVTQKFDEGASNDFVEKAASVGSCVSLIWGIWHLIDLVGIEDKGGDCPRGLTGEAVIELLEPFQLATIETGQPEMAVLLLAFRAISAIVAGVARF